MPQFFSSTGLRILQVGWTHLGAWWNYADLSAPYWRFYWNNSIGASIIVGERRIALNPEKIYVLPPDSSFSSSPPQTDKEIGHFYIHFTIESDVFSIAKESLFLFNVSISQKEEICEIISLLKVDENFKAEMLSVALLGKIIASLPVKISEKSESGKLCKAIEILKNHCERGISNTELSKKFSMSTNAFLRFFKKSTGTSPQKYLKDLRVQRACLMLHYTEKSIKEIADNLGFCDRYHFTKVFSEIRGESPGSFRRKIYSKQKF